MALYLLKIPENEILIFYNSVKQVDRCQILFLYEKMLPKDTKNCDKDDYNNNQQKKNCQKKNQSFAVVYEFFPFKRNR